MRELNISLRNKSSVFVIALWLVAFTILTGLWIRFQDPAALSSASPLLIRVVSHLGAVVLPDPSLAMRIRLTRCIVLSTVLALVAIAFIHRDHVARSISDFASLESDPLNLAIFRIVLFWQIYILSDASLIVRVASLPTGLQYPPQTALTPDFMSPLALWPKHLVDPQLIFTCVIVLKWAAIAACIGVFARYSAAAVSLLFLLAWGRLQWYGKIDHLHHLLWFALILMLSPCADVLSVDAIFLALKKARYGTTTPPGASRRYGIPLICSMLLFGVIYFFPGIWKICRTGLDWIFSENPRLLMEREWRLFEWLPSFRFDRYPALYHAGALFTVIVEVSFVFLLLFRRTRIWAATMGFAFHWMTYATLDISFNTLRNCYVIFVDWGALCRRVGHRLFLDDLSIYHAPSLKHRRVVSAVRRFDVFDRITWIEGDAFCPTSFPFGVIAGKRLQGMALYCAAIARMPFLIPALPFLLPISHLSFRTNREESAVVASLDDSNRSGSAAVIVMGSVLLAANIWAGTIRATNGWPFACYPPFDGLAEPTLTTLRILVTLQNGQEQVIVPDAYREIYGNRWNNLLQRVLQIEDRNARNRRLTAVWEVVLRQAPELRQAIRVRFVSVEVQINPDKWTSLPADPHLLYEFAPQALPTSPVSPRGTPRAVDQAQRSERRLTLR